jgi:hypothetical protein
VDLITKINKMEATTNVFLSESDVRKIVKQHLGNEGYKQIGELEINVRSKKDIPKGATAGDVVGINAKVEKCA